MIVDPSLWNAYQIGIILGILILTTLILFPGGRGGCDHTPTVTTTIEKNRSGSRKDEDCGGDLDRIGTNNVTAVASQQDHRPTMTTTAERKTTVLPIDANGTPQEQQQQHHHQPSLPVPVVEQESNMCNDSGSNYWTPHRRLNIGVYFVLWVIVFVVLAQSYNTNHNHNPWTELRTMIELYFPQEGAILFSYQRNPPPPRKNGRVNVF